MKSNSILVVAVAFLLALPALGYCTIYDFTNNVGGIMEQGLRFRAAVDGVMLPFDGSPSQSDHTAVLMSDNYNGRMLWEVDTTGMTTTFTEVSSQQDGTIQSELTITKRGGFGVEDFVIPFTINLINSSANNSASYGPYAIEPDLSFEVTPSPQSLVEGSMNFSGYVELFGEQNNFDLTRPIGYHGTFSGTNHFDDSGYPKTLILDIEHSFPWLQTEYMDKIIETSAEGHLVELYVSTSFFVASGEGWEGVPEPATLLLLGLGAVMLRKRYKS